MTYSRSAKKDLLGKEFVLNNLRRLGIEEVKMKQRNKGRVL